MGLTSPSRTFVDVRFISYLSSSHGHGFHGIRSSLGSDRLLGGHRYYQSFFCFPLGTPLWNGYGVVFLWITLP